MQNSCNRGRMHWLLGYGRLEQCQFSTLNDMFTITIMGNCRLCITKFVNMSIINILQLWNILIRASRIKIIVNNIRTLELSCWNEFDVLTNFYMIRVPAALISSHTQLEPSVSTCVKLQATSAWSRPVESGRNVTFVSKTSLQSKFTINLLSSFNCPILS